MLAIDTIQSAQKSSKFRGSVSTNKASGDSKDGKSHEQCSRNKNKIPKSLRYDLENALVGLCDVWFEEIKPYLVRNKIKLHVNGGDATQTPACSHLDPASTASECGLCRLLFNAGNSIESAVTQAASITPSVPFSYSSSAKKQPCSADGGVKSLLNRRKYMKKVMNMNVARQYSTTRSHSLKNKSTQTDKQRTSSIRPIKHQARCDRCPATTQICCRRFNQQDQLFKDDLINIIAENHDKYLKVIYKSPTRVHSSMLNLFALPNSCGNLIKSKKVPPWR